MEMLKDIHPLGIRLAVIQLHTKEPWETSIHLLKNISTYRTESFCCTLDTNRTL